MALVIDESGKRILKTAYDLEAEYREKKREYFEKYVLEFEAMEFHELWAVFIEAMHPDDYDNSFTVNGEGKRDAAQLVIENQLQIAGLLPPK